MKKQEKQKLKLNFERDIKNEKYDCTKRIPSEPELMEIYGVSRVMLREITDQLVNDGILYRRRGVGTFINTNKINDSISMNFGLKAEMEKCGKALSTSECTIEKVDINLSNNRRYETQEYQTFLIKRVRCIDNEPLVISYSYITSNIDLTLCSDEVSESLYVFLKKHNIMLARLEDEIEGCPANDEVARCLNLAKSDIVLKKTREGYDAQDMRIEYTYSYFNPMLYKYKIKIFGNGEVS